MIGSIRRQMQKRGAKVVLWLTLFSLAGSSFLFMFRFSQRFKDDSVGMVNDQDINYMDYKRKLVETQHYIQEIRKMYGKDADAALKMWGLDKKPEAVVLEGLITEKVAQSAADTLGTSVSKEFIQAKLKDPFFIREHLGNLVPPQVLVGGAIDVTSLKYYLDRQGISEEAFEETLNDTMLRFLFEKLVEGSLYVPRSVLKENFERMYLKKKYALISLSYDDYLKKARAEKLTDAEIEKYFIEHKEDYRIPEKRSGRLWSFDAETYGIALSEKDIESEYHKRKRGFIEKPEEYEIQHILLKFDDKNKVEVRAKAQELLKQVKDKPELFEKVASENSQAKEKGSKVAIKQGEKKDPLFERTVFGLTVNEISPVIETSEGFEIIKLVGKKDPVFKPLEKIKDTLVKTLKQEKFGPDFNAHAQRVISQARDLPEVVTNFIAEKHGQESKLENITVSEVVRNEKLFGLEKVGDRAFFQEESKGVIIELTSITPSVLPPLSDMKEKVTQDIYKKKAHDALEAELAAAASKIKGGQSVQQVAQSLKGTVETTDFVDFNDPASYKKLQEKNLPLERMMMLTKPNSVVTDITKNNGYVVQLLEIEPFKEEEFKKKKGSLETQARQQEVQALVGSFIQALRKTAKIDLREELKRQIGGA